MPNITSYSWDQIEVITVKLAEKIKASGYAPDVLVGIARGGLAPLTILSHLLNVPSVTTITARSYEGSSHTNRHPVDILYTPKADFTVKKVLLVDEISDSSQTTQKLATLLKERFNAEAVKTATLFVNSDNCQQYPDFYIEETKDWIDFPWEKEPI